MTQLFANISLVNDVQQSRVEKDVHQKEVSDSFIAVENKNEKLSPETFESLNISKCDRRIAKLAVTMLGVSQLLIWNCFLVYSLSLNMLFPNTPMLQIGGGTEHAAAFFAVLFMFKVNGFNNYHVYFWSFVNTVLFITLPLVTHLTFQNKDQAAAFILITILCLILGLASGCMHSFGYNYAALLPENCVGYVSVGNGVAGLFAFVVYSILFMGIFNPKSSRDQVTLGWYLYSSGAVVSLIQAGLFYMLTQKLWFIKLAERAKLRTKKQILNKQYRRNIIAVVKDSWSPVLCAGSVLLFTLFLFPTTAPYSWNLTENIKIMLNGSFAVIDFLLRLLSAQVGQARIPNKYAWACSILRAAIFIPLFIIPAKISDIQFLKSVPWLFFLMALFTASNGWLITSAIMNAADTVSDPRDNEIVANLISATLIAAVVIGIYSSQLINFIGAK